MAGCVSFISCTGTDKSRQNKLPEKTVPKVTHAFEETNDTLVEQNDDTKKDSVSVVSQPVTMVLKPICEIFHLVILWMWIHFLCIRNMILIRYR